MSDAEATISEEAFLGIVAAIQGADLSLSPLAAAILAAPRVGFAKDTRTFARILGIEHALVLREVNALAADEVQHLRILARNARTQRTEFELTDRAAVLVMRAMAGRDGRSPDR